MEKKKSIPPKSLLLDTYPFVCVQLPEKVVSGKAPVAFKSWAFPDKNVVHYLPFKPLDSRLPISKGLDSSSCAL